MRFLHLAAGVLLAGLAIVLWFAIGRASPETPSTSRERIQPTPGETLESVAPEEPAEERAEVTKRGSSPAVESIRVRVVEKSTDAPVPRARVMFHNPDFKLARLNDEDRLRIQALSADLERLLGAVGASTRTDLDGYASVPKKGRFLVVAARRGDCYGQATFDTAQDGRVTEHVLRIEPDKVVRIQVVSADDKPVAGVPILFHTSLGPQAVGVTEGPEGLVVVRHLQTLARGLPVGDGGRLVQVGCDVPAWSGPEVEIDLDAPPLHVVELRMPSVGKVVVRIADAVGRPVAGPFRIRLQLAGAADGAFRKTLWTRVVPAGGEAVFSHVALGSRFKISARIHGKLLETVAPGPLSSGEVRTVTLSLAGTPRLSARVLDSSRRPLSRRWVLARFRLRGREISQQCRTDGEGRLHVVFAQQDAGETVEDLVLESLDNVRRPEGILADLGVHTLREVDGELGDVIVTKPPLILAGWFVETTGEPCRDVEAYVERFRDQHGDRSEWTRESSLSFRSQPNGSFEFRGVLPPGRLRLRVVSAVHVALDPIAFERGEQNLRVRMTRGGVLRALVQVDAGVPAGVLRLELSTLRESVGTVRASGSVVRRGRFERRATEGDRYVWSRLARASYVLTVGMPGSRKAVARIDGIDVRGGESWDEPLMIRVDLRGRLRLVRITVLDPDGRPDQAASGVVLAREAGTDGSFLGFPLSRGKVVVIDQSALLDLCVVARGYRPRLLRHVSRDRTVRLRRALDVVVQLQCEARDTFRAAAFVLALYPLGTGEIGRARYSLVDTTTPIPSVTATVDGLLGSGQEYEVPATARIPCSLPRAGKYRAVLSVATHAGERIPVTSFDLEVPDSTSGEPRVIEARVPRGRVDAALRWSRGR